MSSHQAPRRWLIAGCGYIGEAIAHHALGVGAATHIVGIRRRPRPHELPWPIIAGDMTAAGWQDTLPDVPFDCVVFCPAPQSRDMAVYRATYVDALGAVIGHLASCGHHLPRLILTSSTGVYAEDEGGWVDELTPTPPATERIEILLTAERLVGAYAGSSCILRFGGIYGPQRTRLLTQAQRTPLPWRPAPHFTNHIHKLDAARSAVHVATLPQPQPIYVATDSNPVDYNVLLARLAKRHRPDVLMPAALPSEAATGKRCRNAQLVASGFNLAYPSYDRPKTEKCLSPSA